MKILPFALASAMFLTFTATVSACGNPSFTAYPREQVNELFATLKENRDDLLRIQAYADLSCSSDQTIRTLAMQQALKKGNPALLRGKAMQDAIGSMKTYVIEFAPTQVSEDNTKRFLARNNGAVTYRNNFYDPIKACVSLGGSSTSCYYGAFIQMRGDRADLRYDSDRLTGDFRLDSDSTLIGRVKHGDGPFIPARIVLF